MKNFIKSIGIDLTQNIQKNIVDEISALMSSKIYEISCMQYEYRYDILCEILQLMNKNQYIKNCKDTSGFDLPKLKDGLIYYIKTPNNTFIRVRHGILKDLSVNSEDSLNNAYSLSIKIIGPNAKHLFEVINNAVRLRSVNKIHISKNVGFHGKVTLMSTPMAFNDIIMENSDKNTIISSLENWRKDKQWYYDHNITYKTGLLFHGASGTGKSSVVKAISNMFGNCRIFTLYPDSLGADLQTILYNQPKTDKEYSIVLIEDIDLLFDEGNKNVAFQTNMLMQILDGIFSTNNTIYIATTNHIEKLAENLIRAGRFDIKVEFKEFDRLKAIEYAKSLGYSEKTLDELNITYPIKPTQLKADLMIHRAKSL